MAKKYIKASALIDAEQFKVSNGIWPIGVEVDITSTTGYVYKYKRFDRLPKEVPSDPEPVEIEIKLPIADKDFIYTGSTGGKQIENEAEFNKKYKEL